MAIGTTAAILGGISAAGGIAKTISGASANRKARKALENFQFQDLTNPYKELSVSTLGADLLREENARATATSIDALRSGGVRGVANVGDIARNNNVLNREIAADLDRQRRNIDTQIANDEARIRGIQENRDLQTVSGLGQQMNVGRQDFFSGLGDISQAGMFFANNLTPGTPFTPTVPVQQNPIAPFTSSISAPLLTRVPTRI